MIRQHNNIQGIHINGTEHKISQFADDTEIILQGDKLSFEETISSIETFSKFSGLCLNSNKTNAVWLGSKQNSPTQYMLHLQMNWNPEKLKIVGIWFTNNLDNCIMENFNEKIIDIKALFKIWIKRQITPLGRIAVLQSLILSKLVHIWMLLPNPPDEIIMFYKKKFFSFVWNNKRDRINRKTSIQPLNKGGLGIPVIKHYIKALQL